MRDLICIEMPGEAAKNSILLNDRRDSAKLAGCSGLNKSCILNFSLGRGRREYRRVPDSGIRGFWHSKIMTPGHFSQICPVRKRTLQAALLLNQVFYRPDASLLYCASNRITVRTLPRNCSRVYRARYG
jgi:hypothetical protein